MIHNKKANVSVCCNFPAGNCELGDDLCWYIHCEESRKEKMSVVKCNNCDKVFNNINNLLQHKKSEHMSVVKKCKNFLNDTCRYGDQQCWFRYDNDIQEVTEQIFKMMEQFTQRYWSLNTNLQ